MEKKQRGFTHEGPSQSQHLLLPTTQGTRTLFFSFLKDGKHLKNISLVLLNAFPVVSQISAEFKIFQNGQIGKEMSPLRAMDNAKADDFLRAQSIHPLIPE